MKEVQDFLGTLRDAYFGMVRFRHDLFIENQGSEIGSGQPTSIWGGSAKEGRAIVSFGVWARRPDRSSIVWGLGVESKPDGLYVEATVEREGDHSSFELWSIESVHVDTSSARQAVSDSFDELVTKRGFLSAD